MEPVIAILNNKISESQFNVVVSGVDRELSYLFRVTAYSKIDFLIKSPCKNLSLFEKINSHLSLFSVDITSQQRHSFTYEVDTVQKIAQCCMTITANNFLVVSTAYYKILFKLATDLLTSIRSMLDYDSNFFTSVYSFDIPDFNPNQYDFKQQCLKAQNFIKTQYGINYEGNNFFFPLNCQYNLISMFSFDCWCETILALSRLIKYSIPEHDDKRYQFFDVFTVLADAKINYNVQTGNANYIDYRRDLSVRLNPIQA